MISFINDIIDLLEMEPQNEEKRRIKLDYKNDKEFRNKFNKFLKKYQNPYPQLTGFNTFLNNLEPDELFYILPNIELDDDKNIEIYSLLQSQKDHRSAEEILSNLKELSNKLFKSYSIKIYGEYRHGIGNPLKRNRVCRFCRLSYPEALFNKKAHAISEGIGNKNLVLYDECDACNNRFSETIEPNLIEYFSLYRTIYGVKGKGGRKKLKGINFDMENKDGILITMHNIEDRPKESNNYRLPLHFKEKVNLQNVYRTFAKYFLSLLEEDKLKYFEKTIKWVNGEFSAKKLPLIWSSKSNSIYTEQPIMTYYLRKSNDQKLPHVICDLQLICFKYVFIIPFSQLDSSNFLKKDEKDYWWNIFKKFQEIKWTEEDFSNEDDKPREFSIIWDFKNIE